jgi:hypothetical protein
VTVILPLEIDGGPQTGVMGEERRGTKIRLVFIKSSNVQKQKAKPESGPKIFPTFQLHT